MLVNVLTFYTPHAIFWPSKQQGGEWGDADAIQAISAAPLEEGGA